MTLNRFRNWLIFAVLASSALAAPVIKNVGFVHVALLDGSGWKPFCRRLSVVHLLFNMRSKYVLA